MKKSIQGGFSLVELMVVVAIIGVLATIAIPRVNKFIAKSRQSEAQINLSSIYTFNKNFYLEYQGYTSAFSAMGYSPEGSLRYNTGFSSPPVGPANYTTLTGRTYQGAVSTLDDCPSNGSNARCRTLNGANNAPPPAPLPTATVPAPFSTFTASSQACLVVSTASTCSSATTYDTWTINQDKNLRNVHTLIE
jgi:type IV pilus assembly protein PilA